MIVAGVTRDGQNYLTDNYAPVKDRRRIEALVRSSIVEFNKEKAKIDLPLYSVRVRAS
jgi:hypothetical protein